MSVVVNPEFIIDLPVEEASKLYLEPAVVANNPFQSAGLRMFRTEFGKRKLRMNHLRVNRNNLQPKAPCDVWNPTPRFALRPESLVTTDYELNGEQCPDEFDARCLQEMRGPLGKGTVPEFGGTPELDALLSAMVRLLSRELTNDIYKIVYWSDTDIRAKAAAGFYGELPYVDNPAARERLFTMLEQQNGVWSEIEARTQTTNERARIAYVDSNDGTIAGNATRAENVTDFFDEMIAQASPLLAGWYDQSQPAYGMPFFAVDGKFFRAYKAYLRSLGTEMANRLIIDGEAVRDSLEYDGYAVVHVREWDAFDAEMGRTGNTARALFTVPENLTLLANMENSQLQPGSGLLVQKSPLLKDKGKVWMYADYSLGMGIAQPELMVAAYNSSTNFL